MSNAGNRAAIALMVANYAVFASASASAQMPAQYPVEDLAKSLKVQFDQVYNSGTLGRDWCYNVESERSYTYWYADFESTDGTKVKGVQVKFPVRIQALYKDAGITKYSSIFVGFQGPNLPDFPFSLNKAPAPATKPFDPKEDIKMKEASLPTPKLAEPGDTDPKATTCMSLADFLRAYVLPYRLTVWDDPAKPAIDKQTFPSDYLYRYWIFGGRGHQVGGVTRFKIGLQVWDSAKNVDGDFYLVVGFGGGAGP